MPEKSCLGENKGLICTRRSPVFEQWASNSLNWYLSPQVMNAAWQTLDICVETPQHTFVPFCYVWACESCSSDKQKCEMFASIGDFLWGCNFRRTCENRSYILLIFGSLWRCAWYQTSSTVDERALKDSLFHAARMRYWCYVRINIAHI